MLNQLLIVECILNHVDVCVYNKRYKNCWFKYFKNIKIFEHIETFYLAKKLNIF